MIFLTFLWTKFKFKTFTNDTNVFFFSNKNLDLAFFFRANSTTVFHSTRAIQKIQKEVTGIHKQLYLRRLFGKDGEKKPAF